MRKYPTPTVEEPDEATLCDMLEYGEAETTDGCIVEPDGMCEHGHPSWLLFYGMI